MLTTRKQEWGHGWETLPASALCAWVAELLQLMPKHAMTVWAWPLLLRAGLTTCWCNSLVSMDFPGLLLVLPFPPDMFLGSGICCYDVQYQGFGLGEECMPFTLLIPSPSCPQRYPNRTWGSICPAPSGQAIQSCPCCGFLGGKGPTQIPPWKRLLEGTIPPTITQHLGLVLPSPATA